MKNLHKYMVVAFFLTALVGCEEEKVIFDSENGPSFATFQEPSPADLIINPAAETENVYNISVSTVSSSDRAVSISVDEESTLDPSFYNIDNLNPVIPAGEFSTSVTITTPSTDVFPETGNSLILNLDSVEGAEIADFSIASYEIAFTVECPEVVIADVTGEGAQVLANEILTYGFGAPISAGGETRSVVEGPGENQITIVGGVGFNSSGDLVLNVDPDSGELSYGGEEEVIFFMNGSSPIYYTEVSGRVLTCIGKIEAQIEGPFGAPLDESAFTLQF